MPGGGVGAGMHGFTSPPPLQLMHEEQVSELAGGVEDRLEVPQESVLARAVCHPPRRRQKLAC